MTEECEAHVLVGGRKPEDIEKEYLERKARSEQGERERGRAGSEGPASHAPVVSASSVGQPSQTAGTPSIKKTFSGTYLLEHVLYRGGILPAVEISTQNWSGVRLTRKDLQKELDANEAAAAARGSAGWTIPNADLFYSIANFLLINAKRSAAGVECVKKLTERLHEGPVWTNTTIKYEPGTIDAYISHGEYIRRPASAVTIVADIPHGNPGSPLVTYFELTSEPPINQVGVCHPQPGLFNFLRALFGSDYILPNGSITAALQHLSAPRLGFIGASPIGSVSVHLADHRAVRLCLPSEHMRDGSPCAVAIGEHNNIFYILADASPFASHRYLGVRMPTPQELEAMLT